MEEIHESQDGVQPLKNASPFTQSWMGFFLPALI